MCETCFGENVKKKILCEEESRNVNVGALFKVVGERHIILDFFVSCLMLRDYGGPWSDEIV